MARTYEELTLTHPCFAQGEAGTSGRAHLPVSPACNIRCAYCERAYNATDDAPGVSRALLTPQQALQALKRAVALEPAVTVAGIAGPGDSLASDHALETFRLIKSEMPGIIRCMSTNGLALAQRAGEVIDAGIDTLTVTVNSVDPSVEAAICLGIRWEGKELTGEEAAGVLIENQLEGIRKVSQAGVTVKVNTVLIPGVNDAAVSQTASAVAGAGAVLFNLIPLIPRAGMSSFPEPGCQEIDEARRIAGMHIPVFAHCRRCRADAVGVPGVSEFSGQVYGDDRPGELTFSHG